MDDRRTLRRRWIAAGLVSVAAHGLVFLGLSLTPREGPPAPPLPVLITLERREQPPPRPLRTSPAISSSAQPTHVHQPPAQPTAVPGSGVAPPATTPLPSSRAPGPSAPQQATAPPPLKLDCLTLGPAARTSAFGREDCEVRKYKKLAEGQAGYEVPDNPAWEAAIAAKQAVHRPLPPEKPSHGDCPNSNLGMGCPGDMLVPMVKRKF